MLPDMGTSAFMASDQLHRERRGVRPDLLPLPGHYEQLVAGLVAQVEATPRQPGVEEIRLPSERAFRGRARALREGIEIERRVYDGLVAMARSRPGRSGQFPIVVTPRVDTSPQPIPRVPLLQPPTGSLR
ncbi:MAG: hypothetical protein IT518_18555 [Burkholderiales bacterium]|nr:hypothetical protein [Burkholderiales bacterium]